MSAPLLPLPVGSATEGGRQERTFAQPSSPGPTPNPHRLQRTRPEDDPYRGTVRSDPVELRGREGHREAGEPLKRRALEEGRGDPGDHGVARIDGGQYRLPAIANIGALSPALPHSLRSNSSFVGSSVAAIYTDEDCQLPSHLVHGMKYSTLEELEQSARRLP